MFFNLLLDGPEDHLTRKTNKQAQTLFPYLTNLQLKAQAKAAAA